MTEAKKAREFWTDGHIVVDSAEDAYSMREGGYNLKHVIEYSALQDLIDENEKLKVEIFSLKREYADNHSGCCDCSMFKSLGKENVKLVEKLELANKIIKHNMGSTLDEVLSWEEQGE